MTKSNLVVVVVLLVLIAGGVYLWSANQSAAPTEPTPPPIGEQTEEPSANNALITVTNPKPNQIVISPLGISGQARGNWYFEATFPIILEDDEGNKLAEGYATAQGDWMTTEFVPFTATLNFAKPTTATGKLILQKSNPSGLPENEDQLSIPVKF